KDIWPSLDDLSKTYLKVELPKDAKVMLEPLNVSLFNSNDFSHDEAGVISLVRRVESVFAEVYKEMIWVNGQGKPLDVEAFLENLNYYLDLGKKEKLTKGCLKLTKKQEEALGTLDKHTVVPDFILAGLAKWILELPSFSFEKLFEK